MAKSDTSLMTADDVRILIRARMRVSDLSMREYAARKGYDFTYLSRVLAGQKEPGESILKAEGLEAVTHYRLK